jgi:bacterial/archaeal transporter family-2 protein
MSVSRPGLPGLNPVPPEPGPAGLCSGAITAMIPANTPPTASGHHRPLRGPPRTGFFPNMTQYALIMLVAGIGIPTLAALNSALGQYMGSPAAAAAILFMVALVATAIVMLATGPQALPRVLGAPKHLLLGGVLVAFYVLSVTYIAPSFGVGNAVFFVLVGQLIRTAAIDHFGLFGAPVTPLSPIRAGGIAIMAFGVWVTQQA